MMPGGSHVIPGRHSCVSSGAVCLILPLVLYSTATKLALHVARQYYGDVHYAWCAPGRPSDSLAFYNPPSSDPIELYWQFRRDIDGGDTHSAAVLQNRNGIKRGAVAKASTGLISESDRDRITSLADLAELKHFEPMLLVIPFAAAIPVLKPVDLKDRANPTSEEYIIDALPRQLFDILQIEGQKYGR